MSAAAPTPDGVNIVQCAPHASIAAPRSTKMSGEKKWHASLVAGAEESANKNKSRTGAEYFEDIDENVMVETADEDLARLRKEMYEYATYQDQDSDTMQMSEGLQSLLRQMHSYASRYHVDLYRSFKENGGRPSCDGMGIITKAKFEAVMLSAFSRMATSFKPRLLEEMTYIYRTGYVEGGTVAELKTMAALTADGKTPADQNGYRPGASTTGVTHCKWIAFANDVGEVYSTFPPRGHGNELGLNANTDKHKNPHALYVE